MYDVSELENGDDGTSSMAKGVNVNLQLADFPFDDITDDLTDDDYLHELDYGDKDEYDLAEETLNEFGVGGIATPALLAPTPTIRKRAVYPDEEDDDYSFHSILFVQTYL